MKDLLQLLDEMDALLSRSKRVPLTGIVMVDEDQIFSLMDEIRNALPEEIRKAKWLNLERDRILEEARREAMELVQNAQDRVRELAEETAVTREAELRAREINEQAERLAAEIREGALAYADDLLASVEEYLRECMETLKRNRRELKLASKSKAGDADGA